MRHLPMDREEGCILTDFDDDPEALAWARARVEREIARMQDFQRQAKAKGRDPLPWLRHKNLLHRAFIGGSGCVIAAFDERRPAIRAAERAAGYDPDEKVF